MKASDPASTPKKPPGKRDDPSPAVFSTPKNDVGKHVSAGVYLYEVKISDYRQIKKMIFLK